MGETMTDLEITKLCAEAMGIPTQGPDERWYRFDPLHDDAQAMALARKFLLDVDFFTGGVSPGYEREDIEELRCWSEHSINRAICECVAKMQQAKAAA